MHGILLSHLFGNHAPFRDHLLLSQDLQHIVFFRCPRLPLWHSFLDNITSLSANMRSTQQDKSLYLNFTFTNCSNFVGGVFQGQVDRVLTHLFDQFAKM